MLRKLLRKIPNQNYLYQKVLVYLATTIILIVAMVLAISRASENIPQ